MQGFLVLIRINIIRIAQPISLIIRVDPIDRLPFGQVQKGINQDQERNNKTRQRPGNPNIEILLAAAYNILYFDKSPHRSQ